MTSGAPKVWPPLRRAAFSADWSAGMSTHALADKYEMNRNTVISTAHRWGLPTHPGTRTLMSTWTPERDAQAIKLHRDGASNQTIGDIMGINRKTVAERLKRLGEVDAAQSRDRAVVRPAFHAAARKVVSNPSPRLRLVAATEKRAPSAPPAPRAKAAPASVRSCLFPMWSHHERPTQRFCGTPAVRGAYCSHHAAFCYERQGGERREDAVA